LGCRPLSLVSFHSHTGLSSFRSRLVSSHWAVFLHFLSLLPSTAGCRPSSLAFSSLALSCLPSFLSIFHHTGLSSLIFRLSSLTLPLFVVSLLSQLAFFLHILYLFPHTVPTFFISCQSPLISLFYSLEPLHEWAR
jgi:hypothetical protein